MSASSIGGVPPPTEPLDGEDTVATKAPEDMHIQDKQR